MRRIKEKLVGLVITVLIGFGFQFTQIRSQTKPNSQIEINAKSLLLDSAQACLKIKTIEYTFEQETITDNGPIFALPYIIATVKQERANVLKTWMSGKYQATGKIILNNSLPKYIFESLGIKDGENSMNFSFGYDGEKFQILSPKTQEVLMVKPPDQLMIIKLLGNVGVNSVGFAEITSLEPFRRNLELDKDFTYLGTTEIRGVKCHKIVSNRIISSPSLPDKSTTIRNIIFIGVDDFLPRRIVSGSIQRTIQITNINQNFSSDTFAVSQPNGYSVRMASEKDTNFTQNAGLLKTGTPAPEWKLKDTAGKYHSLSDYRGKVVIMDFWATWCGPCIASMPVIQALHKKYEKQGVVVIGVSNREEKNFDAIDFFKRKGFDYQLLLNGESIVSNYRAEAIPTLYIIGKEGEIIYAKRGYNKLEKAEHGEIEAVIDQYLKDGSFKQIIRRGFLE